MADKPKIVCIGGRSKPEPDADLIEYCKELLRAAEAGELRSFHAVAEIGPVDSAIATFYEFLDEYDSFRALGLVEALKEYVQFGSVRDAGGSED